MRQRLSVGEQFRRGNARSHPDSRATSRAVGVLGLEPAQDPGPVEPVVNEGVGHEQAHSGREPAFPLQVCSKQEVGKGHRDDLAPDPVHAAKRLKKSHSHPLSAIRSTPLVGCCAAGQSSPPGRPGRCRAGRETGSWRSGSDHLSAEGVWEGSRRSDRSEHQALTSIEPKRQDRTEERWQLIRTSHDAILGTASSL